MPSLACPICEHQLNRAAVTDFGSGRPVDWFDCPICSRFGLEGFGVEAIKQLVGSDLNKRALLRYSVAKIVSNNNLPIISRDVLEHILKDGSLPQASEQADNLIVWLGQNSLGPGEPVALDWNRHGHILGIKSFTGLQFVFAGLRKLGLVDGAFSQTGTAAYHLTFPGWERFHALQRATAESRTAFMAMKFGKPETDRLFRDHLKPAVKLTGFELRRMDDRPKAGLIDQRMEVEIRTSRFLVAELTHGNRGAYWEAGFASGLGKPVFYLCETNKFRRVSTHFDTNHHYTIAWSASDPQAAADELKAAIRATLPAEAKLTDS